jgi:putative oxidoreductase
MKYAGNIVGALIGFLFVLGGVIYFLKLVEIPELPEGSMAALFNTVFLSTGYMDFVKGLEILGGILLALPRTRNLGLLVLGPILINILATHLFVMKEGLLNPILIFITAGIAFLLWTRRAAFGALVTR